MSCTLQTEGQVSKILVFSERKCRLDVTHPSLKGQRAIAAGTVAVVFWGICLYKQRCPSRVPSVESVSQCYCFTLLRFLLGMEPRAVHILGKCYTTELYPQLPRV